MFANIVKEAAEVIEAMAPGASRPIRCARLLMDATAFRVLQGWAQTQGHTITEAMHGECAVVCLTVTRPAAMPTDGVPMLRNHQPAKPARR